MKIKILKLVHHTYPILHNVGVRAANAPDLKPSYRVEREQWEQWEQWNLEPHWQFVQNIKQYIS